MENSQLLIDEASRKLYFYYLIKTFAQVGDYEEPCILLTIIYFLYTWFQENP